MEQSVAQTADLKGENRTAAHYLLATLKELGIQHVFANTGTDHAPLIEEMARWRAEGSEPPGFILCPHENTAAHMAGGYALVTGEGQPVLVHVDAGTANAAVAMHNLFRTRLPVMLMAGKAPYSSLGELEGTRDNYVHFVQEPLDQGALVRPYVKWEYVLQSAATTRETLLRAHAVMQSDPPGPVYLMLPRETLTQTYESAKVPDLPCERHGPSRLTGTDPETISALGQRLLTARNPILITSYAGLTDGASEAIDALSRSVGMKVFEANMIANISHEMPCFCGADVKAALGESDFVLLIDTDVPYIPSQIPVAPQTFWAHIDRDVLKSATPIWSFPGHMRVTGNSARILDQLNTFVSGETTARTREEARRRRAEIEELRAGLHKRAAHAAADKGSRNAINPSHLFATLSALLEDHDIVLHEAVRNQPDLVRQLHRPVPKTLVRVAGGGLGASGGMALGVKLANPEAMAVQIVGDGSFYFNSPMSVFAVSRQYDLPLLTIVLDNGGWSAVKASNLKLYPEGHAKTRNEHQSALFGDAQFNHLAAVLGYEGLMLDDPAVVPEILNKAVATVRQGRSAIVHVRVTPH